jgi:trimeric autotransporter adhesin
VFTGDPRGPTPPANDNDTSLATTAFVTSSISSSGGITNLNNLTASTQWFSTGIDGNDFGITSSGIFHTFNLPNASATARGVISTGTQTIAGAKTFTSTATFSNSSASAYFTGGNVGIGTTSPSTELDIANGQLSGVDVIYGDSSGALLLASYDKNTFLNSYLGFFTANGSSSGERLRITSSGDVGIGTTNPSQKLDVIGSIRFSNALMPNNSAGISGQVLTSSGSGSAPTWQFPNVGGINGSGAPNYLAKFTTNSTTLGNSIIYNSGTLVGINTINPLTTLDVNGNFRLGNSSSIMFIGDGSTSAGSSHTIGRVELTNYPIVGASIGDLTIGARATENIHFGTNSSSSQTPISRLAILANGNVGIGTTSPSTRFKVAQEGTGPGTVSATSGSTFVSGNGTSFLTTFQLGDQILISGQSPRTISTISSNTALIVTNSFSSSFGGQTYTVNETRFSVAENGDIDLGGRDGLITRDGSRFISMGPSSLGYTDVDTNLFVGINSGNSTMGGSSPSARFNTGLGTGVLSNLTTGYSNVGIGHGSLSNLTSGNNNTALGHNAGTSSNNLVNATAIGADATVNASHKVRIGSSSVTTYETQVPWITGSDIRLKKDIKDSDLGLDFINKLRPVSYRLKIQDKNEGLSYGFIAQEVEEALGDRKTKIIDTQKDEEALKFMRYTDLIAPMTKAIQEQQEQIEELRAEIEFLKTK